MIAGQLILETIVFFVADCEVVSKSAKYRYVHNKTRLGKQYLPLRPDVEDEDLAKYFRKSYLIWLHV